MAHNYPRIGHKRSWRMAKRFMLTEEQRLKMAESSKEMWEAMVEGNQQKMDKINAEMNEFTKQMAELGEDILPTTEESLKELNEKFDGFLKLADKSQLVMGGAVFFLSKFSGGLVTAARDAGRGSNELFLFENSVDRLKVSLGALIIDGLNPFLDIISKVLDWIDKGILKIEEWNGFAGQFAKSFLVVSGAMAQLILAYETLRRVLGKRNEWVGVIDVTKRFGDWILRVTRLGQPMEKAIDAITGSIRRFVRYSTDPILKEGIFSSHLRGIGRALRAIPGVDPIIRGLLRLREVPQIVGRISQWFDNLGLSWLRFLGRLKILPVIGVVASLLFWRQTLDDLRESYLKFEEKWAGFFDLLSRINPKLGEAGDELKLFNIQGYLAIGIVGLVWEWLKKVDETIGDVTESVIGVRLNFQEWSNWLSSTTIPKIWGVHHALLAVYNVTRWVANSLRSWKVEFPSWFQYIPDVVPGAPFLRAFAGQSFQPFGSLSELPSYESYKVQPTYGNGLIGPSAPPTINVNGPVYGVDHLDELLVEAHQRLVRRGGYIGVNNPNLGGFVGP